MAVRVEYILTLRDRVTAQARKMQAALHGVKRVADSVNTSLVAMGGAVAIGGVKKVVDLADTQIKAEMKVRQAIAQTNGAARQSFEELAKYASELQSKTLFGDEDILNYATAQLLTFTNLAGDNFKATQAAALDLSTLLDGDLKSASIQLGKALNDPVANLSALSKSGVQFSKTQKTVIKNLVETNRLADAQAVILAEINTQYGGQAEAMRKVGLGAFNGGWMDFTDSLEQVGMRLLPIFDKIGDRLTRIADFIKNNTGDVVKYTGYIIELGIAFAGVIIAVKGLAAAIGVLQFILANKIAALIIAIATALGICSVKIDGFGAGIVNLFYNIKAYLDALAYELMRTVTKFVAGLHHMGMAIAAIFKGEFAEAGELAAHGADLAFRGLMQTIGALGNAVFRAEFSSGEAEEKAESLVEKLRKIFEKLDLSNLDLPEISELITGGWKPTDDLDFLKSEGLTASGGIKQFNINIQTLTGIENLTTQMVAGGATQAGREVRDALLMALADIQGV